MKVQSKIILLLIVVVAIFLAGLATLRIYDRRKFRQIAEDRFRERNSSFEEFLNYHGQPLKMLVFDSTTWDSMVEAIKRGDQEWFGDNAGEATLDSFHANALWIYRPDGTLARTANNIDLQSGDGPVPPEAFQKIFASEKLAHFFAKVPQGLLEIWAATVHPSKDFERSSPPAGFFFAGRLWNQPVLREMSLFTGNQISLALPTERGEQNVIDQQNGQIAFSRTLNSWDGQPLAQLVVRNESAVVKELNRSSERLLLALLLFSLVLLFLLAISLVRWVSRPLRQTMESLQRDDPKPIAHLAEDNSEFGELARTIQKFFAQRDNLLREMDERRATEEALRKSEAELRHSQKMEAVGRLAGGVAHDFNNLLTAIIGYAELITERTTDDPLVRQHADLIQKAGQQAASLTRQLLAFSRKQLLQPRVIDLNRLVIDMEKLLRRVIGERFDLRTDPQAQIGRVMADPSQVEQVILNLGVNARDAMPTGGTLTIQTRNVHLDEEGARLISVSLGAGDYVELSVADTGTGMDENTKAHIFEPFFTTKGPGKGTGLGLATVYGIVRQSGGGISVESDLHKGSTFRIYFPLEKRPLDARTQPAPPMDKSRNFETVLVVEDEEIVRTLVCDVLEEEGYQVLCASDGIEGCRIAKEFDGHIHMLVTDVIMPHMNGPELADKLTSARPDIRVLYISGYSNNDISEHGVVDRQIELLQKPFTPQTLARRVRDILEAHAHSQVVSAR
ncbi:MAG: ATP-binding protein [Verrucomicrobiota bacterium]|nr:ATP-binding protein [Verrucomicrobiota bacterium]